MAAGLGMPGPLDDLVVEVRSPTGVLWRFGREDVPNRIEGTAAEFARVGVRRLRLGDAGTLRAHGPLAEVALLNLKAYL
jgi:enediyne biosynthesis protein E11